MSRSLDLASPHICADESPRTGLAYVTSQGKGPDSRLGCKLGPLSSGVVSVSQTFTDTAMLSNRKCEDWGSPKKVPKEPEA
jgi:hypothetical protein